MLKTRKRANILFLPRIKESDFISIEDLFENKIQLGIDGNELKECYKYDKIPKKFYSVETWIEKTNLKCWCCTRNFSGRPWFIPSYVSVDENNKECVDVKGNFCSSNCAANFIMERYRNNEITDAMSMLLWLCGIFANHNDKTKKYKYLKISPSNNKECLEEYGGSMTVEQYAKDIATKKNEYSIFKEVS